MRSLRDFTTDDLKYLKIGSIATIVIAFLFAWYLIAPLLTNISAVIWFSVSEDWIRENLQGARYAEDSQIVQALKRDTRWICEGVCIIAVVIFGWRLTFLDPAFYRADEEESSETDQNDT